MDNTFKAGITCIVMDDKDNVATVLKDYKKGEVISFTKGGVTRNVELKEDVNFGHKTAISNISKSEKILKYGETIGVATEDIDIGQHVHVHNLEGIRGRGDKKMEGTSTHANI